MDLNKRLKQKHKKIARKKRIENIIYKVLKPLTILSEHIEDKKHKKFEAIREAGRNMTMGEAADIAIEIIIDKLIKWEEDIELIVAKYGDCDYDTFTALRWLLNNISTNNKNKEYEMLQYYLYKHERYNDAMLDFNRQFTEIIYKKIKNYKDIRTEWVIDKEKYGYFKSRSYEKTLVIGLKVVSYEKDN